ncbi:MAG: hypothetical protein FJ006_08660 [Chloroflexi bacterium]|nr:hypothetical protein [Chloroflexota bacterium]
MKKRVKRKSPSRAKYEQSHPVVSFRVSRKLHDRIQIVKRVEGQSLTDIVEAGVGLFEVKIRAEEEIRQQAFQEGHIKGYTLAESLYKVTFPCSVCGEQMEVDHKETKRAVREFLIDNGWGHRTCIERYQ